MNFQNLDANRCTIKFSHKINIKGLFLCQSSVSAACYKDKLIVGKNIEQQILLPAKVQFPNLPLLREILPKARYSQCVNLLGQNFLLQKGY